MALKHAFVSSQPEGANASLVRTSNWNAAHTIDTDGLTIPANTGQPTTPSADNMTLFCQEIANRTLPAIVTPTGDFSLLQVYLGRNRVSFWNPPGNATTAPGVFGFGAFTVVSGGGSTFTARNIATTNALTRIKRVAVVSTGTSGTLGSLRDTTAQYTVGDGFGLGGFLYTARFATSDGATVSGARAFVGLTSATNAPTNVEPSTLTNAVGIAQLSTDATQWYIVYGGSAAQTAIALGTGLGAPTLTNTAFELSLFSPTDVLSTIHYEVRNISSGVKVTGTLGPGSLGVTTPATTTLLAPRFWRTNNATALAVGLDICSLYMETVA